MKRATLVLLLSVVFVSISIGVSAEPWKFAVIADSQGARGDNTDGVSVKTLGAVVQDVVENTKPDLVLFAGDLVYGTGTEAGLESQLMTFRKTMEPAYSAKIPVYAIRGSHDVGKNIYAKWSNKVWNKVFSGKYAMPQNGPADEKGVTYSFTHKSAFFVGLDCYKTAGARTLTLSQDWLDKELAANKKPHVFAFSHTQIEKVEHSESLENKPEMRNGFVKSLVDAGSRAYFCGHMHVANHTRLNDTKKDPDNKDPADDFHQIIVPPAGLKFYKWGGRRGPQVYNGKRIPGRTPHKVHHIEYKSGYVVVEVDREKVTIVTRLLGKGGKFENATTFTYTCLPKRK